MTKISIGEYTDAEFRALLSKTTKVEIRTSLSRPKGKFIGCPLPWFKRVALASKSKADIIVALHVYRLSQARRSKTVTVANADLAELGVDRRAKGRALRRLHQIKIFSVTGEGKASPKVTILE